MLEIKLTQKQEQVLNRLEEILDAKDYEQVKVSDIYCDMTAISKVIGARWFNRTFDKLIELGLVEKEDMEFTVPGGFKKGEVVKTYCYKITDLGFEYLGIINPNKPKELQIQDDIQFNIKAAKDRLPKGYSIVNKDGQFCILNKKLEVVEKVEDIPQEDYILKNELVFVQNAFNFVHYANVLIERLFKLQPITPQDEVELTEQELNILPPKARKFDKNSQIKFIIGHIMADILDNIPHGYDLVNRHNNFVVINQFLEKVEIPEVADRLNRLNVLYKYVNKF